MTLARFASVVRFRRYVSQFYAAPFVPSSIADSLKGSLTMETVTLYRPNDLHSEFVSPDGAVWSWSTADEYYPCDVCGDQIERGYVCLDGGDWACACHVTIVPDWLGWILRDEFNETISFRNRIVAMRCTVGAGLIDSGLATQDPNRYLGFVQARA
jgi:hypothetical protein